jgi:rubrerythrin
MAKNSGHKLYGIFRSNYVKQHGVDYRGSLYQDAGMLKRISEEIGEDTLEQVIEYYFKTRSHHDISTVCFNYNKILDEIELTKRDQLKRELLRKRTRSRIEELGIPVGMEKNPDEKLQHLICSRCGAHWERRKTIGRPPKSCPTCKGIS